MIRLLTALIIAGALLPAETITSTERENAETRTSLTVNYTQVSTQETMDAIYSLYVDVTSFCARNEDTCETGKAISKSALTALRSTLADLVTDENVHMDVDTTLTGAVEK